MVTGVKAHYFTLLNVTYFSSFWFLGGSDTGLAPFFFTFKVSKTITFKITFTSNQVHHYMQYLYIEYPLTAYLQRVYTHTQGTPHLTPLYVVCPVKTLYVVVPYVVVLTTYIHYMQWYQVQYESICIHFSFVLGVGVLTNHCVQLSHNIRTTSTQTNTVIIG